MTNNKDFLSQEEIDALLNQTSNNSYEDEEDHTDVEDYLTTIEQDALGEIGNISFGSAATALSTLLGRKVDITTPKVSAISKQKLKDEFPKPHVAVHVNYVEGFNGVNLLVIKTRDAQVIANLMMGGDGTALDEELSEFHISAVQEAMNQMMGSSATSMSTIFNRFVNISPPGIDILDLAEPDETDKLPDEQVFIKVSFRLTIKDLIDSTIMQLLPVRFAREMVSLLMGSQDTEPSAPAPEPIEEPQAQSAATAASSPSVSGPPPAASIPAAPTQAETAPPFPQPDMAPPHQQPAAAGPANYGNVPVRNVNVQPVQFSSFDQTASVQADDSNLNLLLDIPLKVTVELGRTQKAIKDILDLSQGSIIELDKLAGEPVDILVNNKLIAKGEVVVIDENFGVRVTDIVNPLDRIQRLQ
ncbi:flagellar motor switch phosphatase FliY [Paenibacillus sp. J2TS4]|uniref:flagellar motor switch phosphatase FliY n=1 Tax=Paenibacillus sp. J2TS4 TaxID=2807194 RepID=UPI001B113637|nr:flagellar motor switch phosphatase FliY [Paenibacillus sp. J2TS4]GIP33077.1 flagellar motor switch phosphatase FliY [Paenibacillus sp. J2TS4]